MALSRLGANTITALTDATTEAKLCNTFFTTLARRVMGQGSWSSTLTRTSLAMTTNTPAFGFTNEFQLPVDPLCLRVISIDETVPGSIDYRIETDKLLTDDGSVKIRYIAELTDTEDWDIYLEEAFEVLLAHYLSLSLSSDKQLSRSLRQEYALLLETNLALDGQQGAKEFISVPGLIEVRR